MRRVFILFTFLCGFCSVPGLATTDDIFRQSDDRFTAAASRFENKKNNYFSSVSVEEISRVCGCLLKNATARIRWTTCLK